MKPILLSGTAAYSQFRLDALRAAMGALVSEQYKKYAPKKNLNEDGKEPEATK
ncbi:MAG: hypothetical protein ACI4QD_04255 [Kiritimatiellia bacterium]